MAIPGKETIIVGAENQATGSMSLFEAFNATANNFTKLFACASPYANFVAGNGISTTSTSSNGTVIIENTGVLSVQAGTGVTVLETDGVVTISASGNGQVGVTNVGVSSSTLTVTNSPIISSGVIQIELPTQSLQPGEYIAPTMTVDHTGRIVEIANTSAIGTVTSIAVTTTGPGLAITGSPVVDDGTITIVNTGVTRLNAGTGISLSGSNGNITVSSTLQSQGTVTRVDVASNTLTILNSPITRSGTITAEIPTNTTVTLGNVSTGNIGANNISANKVSVNDVEMYGNINWNVTTGIRNLTGAPSYGAALEMYSFNAGFSRLNYADTNMVYADTNGVGVKTNATGTPNFFRFYSNAQTSLPGVTVIGGNVNVGANGQVTVANTSDANTSLLGNTTAGALTVAGGASVTKNLRVGNGVITGNVLASNVSSNYFGVSGNIEWSMGTKLFTTNYGTGLEVYSSGAGWAELNYGNSQMVYADANEIGIEANATGTTKYWRFAKSGDMTAPGNITLGAVLKLTPQSTAPSSPSAGMIYFDSTIHKLKVYTGSAWETITSA